MVSLQKLKSYAKNTFLFSLEKSLLNKFCNEKYFKIYLKFIFISISLIKEIKSKIFFFNPDIILKCWEKTAQ